MYLQCTCKNHVVFLIIELYRNFLCVLLKLKLLSAESALSYQKDLRIDESDKQGSITDVYNGWAGLGGRCG